jgi:hypothetical protein
LHSGVNGRLPEEAGKLGGPSAHDVDGPLHLLSRGIGRLRLDESASAGDSAKRIFGRESASAVSLVRFQTVTSAPEPASTSTRALPIDPVPITDTSLIGLPPDLAGITASGSQPRHRRIIPTDRHIP